MTDMVQSFASIVESTCRLGSDAPEDDTLHAVAALYQSRANSTPIRICFWQTKTHVWQTEIHVTTMSTDVLVFTGFKQRLKESAESLQNQP